MMSGWGFAQSESKEIRKSPSMMAIGYPEFERRRQALSMLQLLMPKSCNSNLFQIAKKPGPPTDL